MKKEIELEHVVIEWEDATVYFEQKHLEDALILSPTVKHTSGWLISNDKKYIRVASECDECGRLQQISVIPKTWCLKITKKKG